MYLMKLRYFFASGVVIATKSNQTPSFDSFFISLNITENRHEYFLKLNMRNTVDIYTVAPPLYLREKM